jgi:hypothetical protein
MGPASPDQTLREALRRLGENGVRAELFLDSAAEHLSNQGGLASQHAAYAVREALMSIVKLGGKPPRGMKEAAKEVVRRWRGDPTSARLGDSIRRLDDVLGGPDPNERRLVQAVAALSRVAPTRATVDLLSQFVIELANANEATHADTPPDLTAVTGIYERTCDLLRDLFGPVSLRLSEMDDLVGLQEPGPEDVARLKQRLGEEHRLTYLFDRAEGPGWFRALRDHDLDDNLLLPSPDSPWVAGPYVARIAETHPDDVRAWLRSLPTALNSKQVGDALRIARTIKVHVVDIVLRLARDHLDSSDVRFQVDGVLRELPPDERDTGPVRSLLHWSLKSVLGGEQGAGDTYMAAGQLQIAVTATAVSNPGAWLEMLSHRGREVAEQVNPVRLRLTYPLTGQGLHAARRPLELISTAVLLGAAASAQAGLRLAERLERMAILPEPLATRVIAQHLLDHLPDTADTAREFIAGRISANERPSPEELALLRRLFDDEVPGIDAAVAAALGEAPAASAQLDDPLPDAMMRAHRWLVAIPDSVAPDWHSADIAITEQVGAASPDGVLIRVGPAGFVSASSPVALDDLTGLPPLDAAARVAAWRPELGGSFLGPSAEGLAQTLRQAIDADPAGWLVVDPVDLGRALRHPVYITVLLQALREHAADLDLDAERVVTLAELVRSEPWPVEDLGGDLDGPYGSWARADDEAIKLLGRLGDLGALHDEVADRAWAQVVDATHQRHDTSPFVDDQERDPVSVAINRPSMRAIEAAFSIGHDAQDVPNEALLSLLDELLQLEGVDGLHGRAMLAVRLPYLRNAAPAWFADREEHIFGDAAPGDLGPATFDLYLEWGRPFGPLVEEQRDRLISALSGQRHEDATQHLLHGLLWRLPGFEASALADILIGAGYSAVSYAGQWLGWALADVEDIDLAPVTELWRELLDRDLDTTAYRGFGWMAVNDRLDQDAWLTLTQETAAEAAGALDEADRVAERAARSPDDARAALIIARLLEDDPEPWDVDRIGARGIEVLNATSDGDAAADLRERLLERGFYNAKEA